MIAYQNIRESWNQKISYRSKKTSAVFFFANVVMIPEITSTHGANSRIQNSRLLSIGTKMTSLGPIVKNMGFREKLYKT